MSKRAQQLYQSIQDSLEDLEDQISQEFEKIAAGGYFNNMMEGAHNIKELVQTHVIQEEQLKKLENSLGDEP